MSVSKDSYDPSKGYIQVEFQERKDVSDFELNELQQIILGMIKKQNKVQLGNVAFFDGLKLRTTGLANTIAVNSGSAIIEGYWFDLLQDIIVDLNPPQTDVDRTDKVYCKFSVTTITSAEDPNIIDDKYLGFETNLRKKLSMEVLVTDGEIPENTDEFFYYYLGDAVVKVGQDILGTADIVDKRLVALTTEQLNDVAKRYTVHENSYASNNSYGHVKIGTGINIDNGEISVAEIDMSAPSVRVVDTEGNFVSEDVEGVLKELFTFASNGKTSIASAIGSPSASGDTFEKLAGDIEAGKNSIATSIGNPAVPWNTFGELSDLIYNGRVGVSSAIGAPSTITDSFSQLADTVSVSKSGLITSVNNKLALAEGYVPPDLGNATSDQVLSGATFSSVNGENIDGTMPDRGAVLHSLPINGAYIIPEGYHDGTGSVTQSVTTKGAQTYVPGKTQQTISSGQYLTGAQTIDSLGGNATPDQVLSGSSFSSNSAGRAVSGTMLDHRNNSVSPEVQANTEVYQVANSTNGTDGYIATKLNITGYVDLTTNFRQYIKNLRSENIKAGVKVGNDATYLTGTFTSDGTATASQILSGKIAYVNGNKITGNIPSKGAQTITPGTSNQTISSGQYLSGVQTIASLGGTATANQVLSGVVFSSNSVGRAVTGTMANRGNITQTITTQGGSYTIPSGYHSGSGKVTASFANLVAGNVKSGVNIGGVVGTLTTLNEASGTATSSASTEHYTDSNGDNTNRYSLSVTGLTFKPKMILILNSEHSTATLYSEQVLPVGTFGHILITNNIYGNAPDSCQTIRLISPANVIQTGFKLPVSISSKVYSWYAIG